MVAWTGPFELLAATAIASLLGSVHCIGMCGPFVALATSLASEPNGAPKKTRLHMSYHLGRLTTYLALGSLSGLASLWIGSSTAIFGIQPWINAGALAGSAILAVGIWRTWDMARQYGAQPTQSSASPHSKWIEKWGVVLAKFRRQFRSTSPELNAYFWGVTTTLLPCGWLYLFLIAALAAPTIPLAAATMVAFWLGTIPLLSTASWFWNWLGDRYRGLSGPLATLVLLAMGSYLLVSRTEFDPIEWGKKRMSASTFQGVDSMMESGVLERGSGGHQASVAPNHENPTPSKHPGQETPLEFLTRMRLELNRGLPCCHPGTTEKNE